MYVTPKLFSIDLTTEEIADLMSSIGSILSSGLMEAARKSDSGLRVHINALWEFHDDLNEFVFDGGRFGEED